MFSENTAFHTLLDAMFFKNTAFHTLLNAMFFKNTAFHTLLDAVFGQKHAFSRVATGSCGGKQATARVAGGCSRGALRLAGDKGVGGLLFQQGILGEGGGWGLGADCCSRTWTSRAAGRNQRGRSRSSSRQSAPV